MDNKYASDNDSEIENNLFNLVTIILMNQVILYLLKSLYVSLCEIPKHFKNLTSKRMNKVTGNGKRKCSKSSYGKTKKIQWTEDEKKAALSAFAQHMGNHTLSSLKKI